MDSTNEVSRLLNKTMTKKSRSRRPGISEESKRGLGDEYHQNIMPEIPKELIKMFVII